MSDPKGGIAKGKEEVSEAERGINVSAIDAVLAGPADDSQRKIGISRLRIPDGKGNLFYQRQIQRGITHAMDHVSARRSTLRFDDDGKPIGYPGIDGQIDKEIVWESAPFIDILSLRDVDRTAFDAGVKTFIAQHKPTKRMIGNLAASAAANIQSVGRIKDDGTRAARITQIANEFRTISPFGVGDLSVAQVQGLGRLLIQNPDVYEALISNSDALAQGAAVLVVAQAAQADPALASTFSAMTPKSTSKGSLLGPTAVASRSAHTAFVAGELAVALDATSKNERPLYRSPELMLRDAVGGSIAQSAVNNVMPIQRSQLDEFFEKPALLHFRSVRSALSDALNPGIGLSQGPA